MKYIDSIVSICLPVQFNQLKDSLNFKYIIDMPFYTMDFSGKVLFAAKKKSVNIYISSVRLD